MAVNGINTVTKHTDLTDEQVAIIERKVRLDLNKEQFFDKFYNHKVFVKSSTMRVGSYIYHLRMNAQKTFHNSNE